MTIHEALTYFKLRYTSDMPSETDNIYEYIDAVYCAGLLNKVYLEETTRGLNYNLIVQVTTMSGHFRHLHEDCPSAYEHLLRCDMSENHHSINNISNVLAQSSIEIVALNGCFLRTVVFNSIPGYKIGARVFLEANERPRML